ncbi:hypothetical protein QTO34_014548 [Cnephaeus nilssonii]|uniref:Large ribosomal subunit protein uL15 n=1 Tax=Cnephaeus nilssonii TaxID=3371016 RepID=A0AA40I6L1_CNENI|nr:hypothetical protein QTO34_014548 [Eptesicus nilssonii]
MAKYSGPSLASLGESFWLLTQDDSKGLVRVLELISFGVEGESLRSELSGEAVALQAMLQPQLCNDTLIHAIRAALAILMQHLQQGYSNYGLRATCGPPRTFIRPAGLRKTRKLGGPVSHGHSGTGKHRKLRGAARGNAGGSHDHRITFDNITQGADPGKSLPKARLELLLITEWCIGYYNVLGKGKLPKQPVIVKAKVFCRGAEEKMKGVEGGGGGGGEKEEEEKEEKEEEEEEEEREEEKSTEKISSGADLKRVEERRGRVENIYERETLISCFLHTSYQGCARNQGSFNLIILEAQCMIESCTWRVPYKLSLFAVELGACPLVHKAFQKPLAQRRLLKGLVPEQTGTQLPRF